MLVYMFPSTRVDVGGNVRAFADSARELTKPTARIALTEVGAFGFFSDRYIIDLVGLVDSAALDWIREYGRPRTTEELETLLARRCATHYVETFGAATPLVGRTLRFKVIEERELKSSNLSGGALKVDRWRLYRLDGQECGRPQADLGSRNR